MHAYGNQRRTYLEAGNAYLFRNPNHSYNKNALDAPAPYMTYSLLPSYLPPLIISHMRPIQLIR